MIRHTSPLITILIALAFQTIAFARTSVFVSVAPQTELVERIGGEHVEVSVFIRKGQNPHHFEPTGKQMMKLSKADVFFSIGMPFEERLLEKLKATASNVQFVDTTEGIVRLPTACATCDHGHEHHHEDEEAHAEADVHDEEHEEEHHHHDHGEMDPHVWLAPQLIKSQAEVIANALGKLDPKNAELFTRNLKAYTAEVDAFNEKTSKSLGPYKGQTFYIYHPAFGYFADAFGLTQKAVEEGGKQPSPKQLKKLVEQAKEDKVRVIFTQPQFDQSSAETIAKAIDGEVASIDPLAEDLLANLQRIADALKAGFEKAP